MEEKLIGKIVGKRFQLINADHFQFLSVKEQDFSSGSEEEHTLFTGILFFKVTDSILVRESKTVITFVQRIIICQSLIAFLKPYFIILVIEYHPYFFSCNGEWKFRQLFVTDVVLVCTVYSSNIH